MKQILANTDLKVGKLLARLTKAVDDKEYVGFDTEVSGPLLRGRNFVNISYAALLGISIAFEDEECYYVPVRHKGNNAKFVDLENVCQLLRTLAGERRLWAHNAKFDHQVMIREGYPMVGMLDSMVAAWLVTGQNKGIGLKDLALRLLGRQSPPYDPSISHKTGAEVLDYACHDALNALQVGTFYHAQFGNKIAEAWFHSECDFAFILAEMKLQGISLDFLALNRIEIAGYHELNRIQTEWGRLAGEISITSSHQLQQLFEEGIWREHSRTATGSYCTSKAAMEHQLVHGRGDGSILASLRLDYQSINKIVSTYTSALVDEATQWADKKLHPDLFQFGTVTGRLSSASPNIQNQPAHGEWAKKIKECFVPDPGMEFTSADYSQVELRYFADYCGGNLKQAFVDGKDLHDVTAEALGVDRQVGKTVNFGFLLYGGGPRKLAGLLGVEEAEAREAIERLHEVYPEVLSFRSRVIETVTARGPIPWCKTRAGRVRHIPELDPVGWEQRSPEAYAEMHAHLGKKYGITDDRRIKSAIRSRGERLVVNYLVQGGSRDLLLLGMLDYHAAINEHSYIYPSYSIITTVHDEVLTQHPYGEGDIARELLKQCLEGAGPKLGLTVPLLAEPKTGGSWAEVK